MPDVGTIAYSLDEDGRILAGDTASPIECEWNDVIEFQDAQDMAGERFIQRYETNIYTRPLNLKLHVGRDNFDVEHGLMLVTDINCRRAVSSFQWKGKGYYPVRPDYGLMCINTNLCEAGLNKYEWNFRSALLGYHPAVDKLYNSIKNGEITATGTHSLKWWCDFWKTRGVPLQLGWLPTPQNDTEQKSAVSATDEPFAASPIVSQKPYTTRLLEIVDKLRSKIGADPAKERWTRLSIIEECHALQTGLSDRDAGAVASVLLPDSTRRKKNGVSLRISI
jgi:hypothetical protein